MKKVKFSFTIALLFATVLFSACKEDKKDEPEPEPILTPTNTITDIDGNVYHYITIGTQTWLVENFKTTRYNDGTPIPNVTDATWSTLTSGAWCNYDNVAANNTKYGKLYNYYAVSSGKLAPAGWHVPSSTEWSTLDTYVGAHLGTSNCVGKALAANTDWVTTTNSIYAVGNDLTKNNSTGFTGLPGGYRTTDGVFHEVGYTTRWWTTYALVPSYNIYYRFLTNTDGILNTTYYNTIKDGYYVRLIKD